MYSMVRLPTGLSPAERVRTFPNRSVDRSIISLSGNRLKTKAIKASDLLLTAEKAAMLGAEVVASNVLKPRTIERKTGTDVVTDTDKAAEKAITACILETYKTHCILTEEEGELGDISSEYLWCIDPLDGTANFSAGRSPFCVSVGVLHHSKIMAGCVIEFVEVGVGEWQTRTFTASRNGGALLNGKPLCVSRTKELRDGLLGTEAAVLPDDGQALAGIQNAFTRTARGLRMSGSTASNLCSLAMGTLDAYYQFYMKPWDVAAAALIVEEAGGMITTADSLAFSVFDRSLVATNDALHGQVLAVTEPEAAKMRGEGVQLGPWHVPRGYRVKAGAQMD